MSDATVPLIYKGEIVGTAIVCRATYDIFHVRQIKSIPKTDKVKHNYNVGILNQEPVCVKFI